MERIALFVGNSWEELLQHLSSVVLLSFKDIGSPYCALVLLNDLVHVFLHKLVYLSIAVNKMLFSVYVIDLDRFLYRCMYVYILSAKSLAQITIKITTLAFLKLVIGQPASICRFCWRKIVGKCVLNILSLHS